MSLVLTLPLVCLSIYSTTKFHIKQIAAILSSTTITDECTEPLFGIADVVMEHIIAISDTTVVLRNRVSAHCYI